MRAFQKRCKQFCGGLPLPSEGRGIEGEGSDGSLDALIAFGNQTTLPPLTLALSPRRGERNRLGATDNFSAAEFFMATEAMRP